MVRYWRHLIRRFFGFVTARPLTPREQAEARSMLTEAQWALFWQQPAADQRHGLEVSHRVLASRPGDRVAATAALLHDVGKRHVRLGAVQRSLATLLDGLRLPLPARYERYRRHGEIGARDLEAAGSDELTIAFARHHPAGPPDGVDTEQWAALVEADSA